MDSSAFKPSTIPPLCAVDRSERGCKQTPAGSNARKAGRQPIGPKPSTTILVAPSLHNICISDMDNYVENREKTTQKDNLWLVITINYLDIIRTLIVGI